MHVQPSSTQAFAGHAVCPVLDVHQWLFPSPRTALPREQGTRQCAEQGFSTAMAGNAMLLSYFLEARESEAALVQTIGVSSNFIMLTQVTPRPPYTQTSTNE